MDQAYIVYSSPFTGLDCYRALCPRSAGRGAGGATITVLNTNFFLEMACNIVSKTPNLSFLFNNLLFQCVTSSLYLIVVL